MLRLASPGAGGYVSGLMPENSGSTPLQTNPGYSEIFSVLGWWATGVGVAMLILIPCCCGLGPAATARLPPDSLTCTTAPLVGAVFIFLWALTLASAANRGRLRKLQ